ncbi:hypothetical protein IW261DRAFT_1642288, partial [Armillaria novae-zelandiae]
GLFNPATECICNSRQFPPFSHLPQNSFDTSCPMALFALESQYLPPTEDYNSLYELAPFSFGSSDTLADSVDFFPDHVVGLDQNGFWPVTNYQTEFIHTPDPVLTYDAFVPLFSQILPVTTLVDVATVIPTPSVESDVQPTDPCGEDADYDLDPDFVDFATEPLPCECPLASAPPSPLTPLPEINDEDSDAEEPVFEESEYEEPASLSGCRKRGRVSEPDFLIFTTYRTDVAQPRRRSGNFKDSLERYTFHDDPQHVRCMKIECQEEFNSVNAAIDHMESAHPKEPDEAKKSKATKKSKTTKKSKAVKKSRGEKQSKATKKSKAKEDPESTVVRCIYFWCNRVGKQASDMRRHLLGSHHQPPRFRCGDCKGLFQRQDPVKRHQERFMGECKGVYAENRPVGRKRARKA